ncbi:ribokinase [Actinomadura flavalba]|uniref:ribokinase n=1 Tax=Actinomadura flavalba TaxID=1120938 RepID=UPI00037CC669|nr:ribokinase [Actinomadura flavalba]
MDDVVVVGSVNADLVVRVERWPGPGETVLGSDYTLHPGGKGANQAVAAARLGGRVALVGRVGDDAHGRFLRDALDAEGVRFAAPPGVSGASGVAFITVGPGGENGIVVAPGANARLTPDDVVAARDVVAGAAVVALQLEVPVATVLAAARLARRAVLNLAPAAGVPDELLALADPLVVNEHEARHLLGGPAEAGGLLARGARSVVLTLGGDGAVVADASGEVRVPAPRVDVRDTTGAGDAFTGALCLRLARGDALAAAARFAVRVGAAAVRADGAQGSYPRSGDALPA